MSNLVYSSKQQIIQNGDFAWIKRFVKSFKFTEIHISGFVNYSYNDEILDSNKEILHYKEENLWQNIMLELVLQKKNQFINMKITHIFAENIDFDKFCFIPVFRNVIFEKFNNEYIAIYFIVMNLHASKGLSSVIKLS